MAFFKLPFDEAVRWWMDVQSWCDGERVAPDNRSGRDQAAAKCVSAMELQGCELTRVLGPATQRPGQHRITKG